MASIKRMLPTKWRKYRLLATFGLTSFKRLSQEIQRFPWSNSRGLIQHVSDRLNHADLHGKTVLLVVKFVDLDSPGALPNHRITARGQLQSLEEAIRNQPAGKFVEIWCCETDTTFSLRSVAGRILFSSTEWSAAQRVEQVWRVSPRLIEHVVSAENSLGFDYLRASRPGWGWSFRFEAVLPSSDEHSLRSMRQDFCETMQLMYRMRHTVDSFVEMLHTCGANAISLEYKCESHSLWFIDWDTECDNTILSRIPND